MNILIVYLALLITKLQTHLTVITCFSLLFPTAVDLAWPQEINNAIVYFDAKRLSVTVIATLKLKR